MIVEWKDSWTWPSTWDSKMQAELCVEWDLSKTFVVHWGQLANASDLAHLIRHGLGLALGVFDQQR